MSCFYCNNRNIIRPNFIYRRMVGESKFHNQPWIYATKNIGIFHNLLRNFRFHFPPYWMNIILWKAENCVIRARKTITVSWWRIRHYRKQEQIYNETRTFVKSSTYKPGTIMKVQSSAHNLNRKWLKNSAVNSILTTWEQFFFKFWTINFYYLSKS